MANPHSKMVAHLLSPRPYPARLSLVIPMYNEEAVVPFLRRELEPFLHELPCETEVVLVNDGSSDRTLEELAAWAADDSRIKIVHLSRNFGHQVAATAGLDFATGGAVVLMDADLQDPLEVIHEMLGRYCDGYDVVYGQREVRAGETKFKLFTAWAFYRVMRLLTDTNLPVDTGDFRLISRSFLDRLASMRETHRFLRGMVAWAGCPQTAVRYCRRQRAAGETKYPFRKMMTLAWTAATSFSSIPLKFSFAIGLVFGLFGVEEACRALLAHSLGWYAVPGWTSLMVVTSILGSAILISISVVGDYVGKIYEQVKGRPLYLVGRTFNIPECPPGQLAQSNPAVVGTERTPVLIKHL
jgi:polyisoprenyl-phosphate glycosyltransferase